MKHGWLRLDKLQVVLKILIVLMSLVSKEKTIANTNSITPEKWKPATISASAHGTPQENFSTYRSSRMKFTELCIKFENFNLIFTDGDKNNDEVSCVIASSNARLSMVLYPYFPILTAET